MREAEAKTKQREKKALAITFNQTMRKTPTESLSCWFTNVHGFIIGNFVYADDYRSENQ